VEHLGDKFARQRILDGDEDTGAVLVGIRDRHGDDDP